MMKKAFLALAILLAPCALNAQSLASPYGTPDFIDTLASKKIVTEIEFVTPRIVGVRHYPVGCTIPRHQLVVTRGSDDVETTISAQNNVVTIAAQDGVTVKYYALSGYVVFHDAAGTVMCREKKGSTALVSRTDAGEKSYTVKQMFQPFATERFYGLGQLQNGSMSQRGREYSYMIEGNMSVWMPYIHSTRGYSLMWNNASPTTYRDNSEGLYLESAVGYGVDYYFMLGSPDDGAETVAQMRELTGQVPMAPLWAYGYFQSKERYQSASETMGVAATYRRQRVPLDCVVQDWQYWGDNNMWNAMEFANPRFSNYQEMIDSIHRMDAHMIISTWANFGPDTRPYSTMKENGWLMKQGDDVMTVTYPGNSGVAVYDPYSPGARDAYWNYLWDGLISKGVDGYWLDSSEPDHYQWGSDMEATFDHRVGLGCSWRSVRNAFPLMHVSGVHDHHRAQPELKDKRCLILTRSAYLGQQRTGANTWSGDVTASWETLANQIPAALNFTATGNPNWNSDIGAFFNGNLGGPGNDEYNELYARWFQFATFCPMMRSHGSGTDKAIYVWGTRGDEQWDNIEKYIRLRYTLLPYIYSTAWAVHSEGESFMNALGLLYPSDTRGVDVKNEYLFGRSLLVAPVLSYKARSRKVYLPGDGAWVDFWTGESHQGGTSVTASCEYDIIPLYVKAGTILPLSRPVQHSDVQAWDTLQLRVYPGGDGSLRLYSDAGDGYGYEQGEYSVIPVKWNDASRTLTLGQAEGKMAVKRVLDIVIVENGEGCGDSLSTRAIRTEYNGTEVVVRVDGCQAVAVSYPDPASGADEQPIDAGKLKPYAFRPSEWTTGDAGRVAQSRISYSAKDGTITVKATGTNNVALQLTKNRNNYYYVPQGHTWMWVKARDISTVPSDSRMWYAFGNWVGEVDAMKVLTADDGDIVVAWNLSSRVGEQLLQPYIKLGTDGAFIFCFGLTSTTGTSVISDIGFGTTRQLNDVLATCITAPGMDDGMRGPETYYTLTGIPVAGKPVKPGIYVTRHGKTCIR